MAILPGLLGPDALVLAETYSPFQRLPTKAVHKPVSAPSAGLPAQPTFPAIPCAPASQAGAPTVRVAPTLPSPRPITGRLGETMAGPLETTAHGPTPLMLVAITAVHTPGRMA